MLENVLIVLRNIQYWIAKMRMWYATHSWDLTFRKLFAIFKLITEITHIDESIGLTEIIPTSSHSRIQTRAHKMGIMGLSLTDA